METWLVDHGDCRTLYADLEAARRGATSTARGNPGVPVDVYELIETHCVSAPAPVTVVDHREGS